MSSFGLPPDIFYGIVFPVVWAALCWSAAYPFWSRGKLRPALVPLGMFLPFIAAIPGMKEVPPLPPVSADGWFFYFGLLALLSASACLVCKGKGAFLAGVVLTLLVTGLCIYPLYKTGAYTLKGSLWWGTLIGLGAVGFNWCLSRIGEHRGRGTVLVPLALGSVLALQLVFSGSAYLAILTGTIAAAAGVGLLFSFFRADLRVPVPTLSAIGLLFAAMVTQGYLYANTSIESALLFAASPALCALGAQEGRIPLRRYLAGACFLALGLLLSAGRYFQ